MDGSLLWLIAPRGVGAIVGRVAPRQSGERDPYPTGHILRLRWRRVRGG